MPEIERLVHHRPGRRHVHAAAEIVAAEPDRRDDQAGAAEIALFQRAVPLRYYRRGSIEDIR